MKVAISFVVIGLLLLGLFLYKSIVQIKDVIDIHVFDTYFVLSYWSFFVLLVLYVANLFSVGGLIGTGFKRRFFLYFFIVMLIIDCVFVWWVWQLFA